MTVAACPQRGCHVETIRAVVQVEVVVHRPAILVHALCIVLEAETLALCFLQSQANHRLRRGGIAGTWVVHHVDMLYLAGVYASKFLEVLHPSSVDIHLGIATPQHLHGTTVLFGFQRGHLVQHVRGVSGFLQDGSCDGGTHGIALDSRLRQAAFHYHAT